jgi:hypothetical protein
MDRLKAADPLLWESINHPISEAKPNKKIWNSENTKVVTLNESDLGLADIGGSFTAFPLAAASLPLWEILLKEPLRKTRQSMS